MTALLPTPEKPYRGLAIYSTVRALAEFANVFVVSANAKYPQFLHPKHFHYVDSCAGFSPVGVATEYLHYRTIPLAGRPFNGFVCARRIMPALRAWRPDLILSYWIYPDGFAALLAGRRLGVPVVVGSRGSDIRRLGDCVTAWFTRYTLRSVDRVLTVSEDLRQHAVELGARPERVKAILNGCDLPLAGDDEKSSARRALGIPANARMVLYIGRLHPVKGVSDLLSAAGQLPHKNLRVVCVGEGILETALRGQSESNGLHGRVFFPGPCRPEEVATWIAACDLICLPSYSEGCPNVVLEAIASGRPVIATNVGGTSEIVGPNSGILVPPGDLAQLRQALAAGLERSWDAAMIAAQFRRPWRQVAAETFAFCNEVIVERRASAPLPAVPQRAWGQAAGG